MICASDIGHTIAAAFPEFCHNAACAKIGMRRGAATRRRPRPVERRMLETRFANRAIAILDGAFRAAFW